MFRFEYILQSILLHIRVIFTTMIYIYIYHMFDTSNIYVVYIYIASVIIPFLLLSPNLVEDGTGMVHPIDDSGCFTQDVRDFVGQHVKAADKDIKARRS